MSRRRAWRRHAEDLRAGDPERARAVAQGIREVGAAHVRTSDVSETAIEAARAREPRGTYLVGSALDASLARTFDLVCVLYLFVHFVDDADWNRLLERLAGLVAELFADELPALTERPAANVVSLRFEPRSDA